MFLLCFILLFSNVLSSQIYSISNLTDLSIILNNLTDGNSIFLFDCSNSYTTLMETPNEIIIPKNSNITFRLNNSKLIIYDNYRSSNSSIRVSFLLDGNNAFRISQNSTLSIISFNFSSSSYSGFDHLLLSFGQIILDSCSFFQINCQNSIIISFSSVYFFNVFISQVSTFNGFLTGKSPNMTLYSFDNVFIEMLLLYNTFTSSFLMCESCSVNIKNSYFR